MLIKVKFAILVIAVPLLTKYDSGLLSFIPVNNDLILTSKGKTIENSISFFTTESDYESLKIKDGRKVYLEKCRTIINGDTLLSDEISTRGGSTLLFRRKSYSFSLNSEASFLHGERKETFRKFYSLGLSMDKNYSSNRLSFEMMNRTGLFDLFYSFGELHINGLSEGICMIIQRPEDWALKKKNSPLMIRRGYNHTIDKMEYSKIIERSDAENFANYLNLIYKSLNRHKGEDLYKTLSQWIDLENYMKWIAFNFLVHNGDYTDEVFLYIDPAIKKFKIIPWDYDDLFVPAPHEGKAESRKVLGDKLIFSSEDQLDIKIATDPYLYKIYLAQLRELLEQLPAGTLKEVFENTYAELYPYYSDNEIISMSRFDSHGETNLNKLESDLRSLFNQLKSLFAFYSDNLKTF